MIHNSYMLERFICVFGIKPDTTLIDKIFKELILFTARDLILSLFFAINGHANGVISDSFEFPRIVLHRKMNKKGKS